jgi:hypothetical protein
LKKAAGKAKVKAAKNKAKAKAAPGPASEKLKKEKAAHSKAVGKHIEALLKKRRAGAKRRSGKRNEALQKAMEPRVTKFTPTPNPYTVAPSGNHYFVPNPFGTNYVVPACPGAHDWLNSRYYQDIKSRALKSRYQFARKHCLRKGMSMAARYECFKLHWK